MALPEVLTVSELRSGLAATLGKVCEPGAAPVFVGARRRPEAVVMSAEHYEQLVEAAERAARQESVDWALSVLRVDGIEPSPVGRAALDAVVRGELTDDEAVAHLVVHYTQTA